MKKLIKLIVMVVTIMTMLSFAACSDDHTNKNKDDIKPPVANTYKGLNGETIIDLGKYGMERISKAENLDSMQYDATEIYCELENTKLFVILIWSDAEDGVAVWSYGYSWNDYSSIDDTWTKQTVITKW